MHLDACLCVALKRWRQLEEDPEGLPKGHTQPAYIFRPCDYCDLAVKIHISSVKPDLAIRRFLLSAGAAQWSGEGSLPLARPAAKPPA
jgi:hypothetical protein